MLRKEESDRPTASELLIDPDTLKLLNRGITQTKSEEYIQNDSGWKQSDDPQEAAATKVMPSEKTSQELGPRVTFTKTIEVENNFMLLSKKTPTKKNKEREGGGLSDFKRQLMKEGAQSITRMHEDHSTGISSTSMSKMLSSGAVRNKQTVAGSEGGDYFS